MAPPTCPPYGSATRARRSKSSWRRATANWDTWRATRAAVLMIFETVPPFRGVKVRADVELDDAHVEDVRRPIFARYLGEETAPAFVAKRGEGIVVRLPTAAQVWDLSRILP